MGAEKKPAAAEPAGGGEKKDDAKVISVYKVDMHCEGCAKKIRRAVKHLEGEGFFFFFENLIELL